MAFLAAIPAAAAAVAGTVGSAAATGAGALASGLGTAASGIGSALGTAGGAIAEGAGAALGGLEAVGQGALNLGQAGVEAVGQIPGNIAQGAETLVEGVQAPFQSASNLATGGGDGALSTLADPMLSGGGGFGGYGNVVSEAPAQLASVPSQGGGLAGMAEAQGFGTQNFGVGAQSMQQPGAMADLMSSPMAQDMGMGRGAVFAEGGQVGQAGGQAVPVGADTATAMATPGGFDVDYMNIAKQMMSQQQQGQEQQGQGAMAAPAPIPGAAPMGALGMPDIQSLYAGGLSAEEMARLRALMGGF